MRYTNPRLLYLLDTPEQRISGLTLNNVIIDGTINEWQNDCGAVSILKDSIQTHVATVDIAKDFIIPIETLFFF